MLQTYDLPSSAQNTHVKPKIGQTHLTKPVLKQVDFLLLLPFGEKGKIEFAPS